MTVLCATNFSPESLEATTVAAELARLRREDLWLLYVLPNNLARAFGAQVLATADQTLKAEASRARKLGATVTPAVLTGSLHMELPRFAAANKVSLVIAGDSRKPPSFTGTGVLSRLAQHLPVPLWVVREPKGIIAWAKGERALKVVLGMDRTSSTDVAVRWLTTLCEYGKLDVVGAHVFWPAVEYHRLGLALPHVWDEQRPELQETMQRELVERLPATLCKRVRLEPAIGRPSDRLNDIALEEKADLLVVGTHHRNAIARLWGTSDQCLQLAPMSVVCVSSPDAQPTQVRIPRLDRVLIATDFSSAGNRAVAYGLSMLQPGGTADLVHVISKEPDADTRRRLVDRLLTTIPPDERIGQLIVRAHVEVGLNPATAIVIAAERLTSHVICVGTRSDAAVSKLIFGSTAQGLLDASTQPVLVVRPAP